LPHENLTVSLILSVLLILKKSLIIMLCIELISLSFANHYFLTWNYLNKKVTDVEAKIAAQTGMVGTVFLLIN
jgi:hypothetical protein